MKILDTLSKEKKDFVPIKKDNVTFYHCGPTVYWTQQIGNMFAMVMADLVHRSFLYLGYKVTMARNYTDVGHLSGDNDGDADTGVDRMEKAADRDKKSPEEIAAYYTQEFNKHVEALNVLTPHHTPAATDYIQEMITLVQELIKKGFAYQTTHAIYFDISQKEDYTKLSGQDMSKLVSGSGHGDVSDTEKKNPGDFALWFFKSGAHEHALQTWENPFSSTQGFPGWHIECSAMIQALLGNTIDLHMGGVEHIPIHHTNEIAQSESAHDAPLANYWIHNEHLLVDGKKMGKSEGNSLTLDDVVDKGYSPLDLRYFFLQAHYRSKQNFTWDALTASAQARKKLHTKVSELPDGGTIDLSFKDSFTQAIGNDFNIPEGLGLAHTMLGSEISDADKKATILDFDNVLGLGLTGPVDDEHIDIATLPDSVQELIKKRAQARDQKDWNSADALRSELADLGYIVKDGAEGQEISQV